MNKKLVGVICTLLLLQLGCSDPQKNSPNVCIENAVGTLEALADYKTNIYYSVFSTANDVVYRSVFSDGHMSLDQHTYTLYSYDEFVSDKTVDEYVRILSFSNSDNLGQIVSTYEDGTLVADAWPIHKELIYIANHVWPKPIAITKGSPDEIVIDVQLKENKIILFTDVRIYNVDLLERNYIALAYYPFVQTFAEEYDYLDRDMLDYIYSKNSIFAISNYYSLVNGGYSDVISEIHSYNIVNEKEIGVTSPLLAIAATDGMGFLFVLSYDTMNAEQPCIVMTKYDYQLRLIDSQEYPLSTISNGTMYCSTADRLKLIEDKLYFTSSSEDGAGKHLVVIDANSLVVTYAGYITVDSPHSVGPVILEKHEVVL